MVQSDPIRESQQPLGRRSERMIARKREQHRDIEETERLIKRDKKETVREDKKRNRQRKIKLKKDVEQQREREKILIL